MVILIFVFKVVLVCLGIVASYALLCFIGQLIPVNKEYVRSPKDVDIYLYSTDIGVHIDMLLPVVNDVKDWTSTLDPEHYANGLAEHTFLGFGWGDKGFYLDIPTWADLTLKIAFKAMFLKSDSIMHVTAHDDLPSEAKYLEKVTLTKEQYAELVEYILLQFKFSNNQVIRLPGKGYTPDDNFYLSDGKYHAFNNCNIWVNKAMQIIGVRTAFFSPWVGGIITQLQKSDNNIQSKLGME